MTSAQPDLPGQSDGKHGEGNGALLENIKVLDFGWVWAGSIPGHILADCGAYVIKVESSTHLDPARKGQPIVGDKPDPEQNTMYHNTSRNKRSLRVNLKDPRGIALVRRLIAESDVILENMSPGAMARLGLGYEDARAIKSDIVYVSFPGMGQWGPTTDIITYGPCITALAGLDSMVGYEDGRVLGMAHGIADPTSGIFTTFMAMSALMQKMRTGEGCHIDLAQIEVAAQLIPDAMLDYAMNGRIPRPEGNRSSYLAPYGVYPSEGDDRWVSIAVETDAEWRALCETMARPEWQDDPRFCDPFARLQHRDELDRGIAEWTRQLTKDDAAAKLQAAGVAATPVYDVADRLYSEFYQQRGTHIEVEHPILGAEMLYGFPWKLSETPLAIRRRAPFLGEDTAAILREVLGMDDAEIASYQDALV